MYLPLFNRPSKRNFLSLVITEGTVTAALWEASSIGVNVLKISETVPWQNEVESGLVDATDVALEQLGSQANSVKEVLLGLPTDWAKDQSIATERKHLLKELTQQFNLKSVGFVVTLESIIAYFREKEGASSNGLVCFLDKAQVHLVTMIRGSAGEVFKVARSASLADDINEAVTAKKLTNLTPRILLASFDLEAAELQALQQQVYAKNWDQSIFVQPPKVEMLSRQNVVEAVSICGGKEVAKSLGILKEEAVGQDKLDVSPVPAVPPTSTSDSFGFKPVQPGGEDKPELIAVDLPLSEEKVELPVAEPVERLAGVKSVGLKLIIVLAVVLLAAGGLFLAARQLASATLTVTRKTETVDLQQNMTLDASVAASDPANNILQATLKTGQVSDSMEGPTTGSKLIGDKSKGSVTIYNRTNGAKLFKAGTVLQYTSSIKFTMDSDVMVASGSAENDYVGKGSVKVTAQNIGAESNIDKGVELTVVPFDKSAYVAKTDDVTVGGNSRKVQTVSDADQKQLVDALTTKLKEEASTTLSQGLDPTQHVIVSDKINITNKSFSADIGAEAKTVSVTITADASAIVYSNNELAQFALAKLSSQVPPGAVVQPDKTTIEVLQQTPIDANKTAINAKISAAVVAPVDSVQLAKLLAGKSVNDAKSFLSSQQTIASYDLVLAPSWLRPLINKLPDDAGRIHITSTAF